MTIDWTAVAGIAAAVAVAVTLILFIVESRRKAAADRALMKKDATSRLLDTMAASIRRNQGLLSSLRFWARPDLEYMLAVPRLLHDLDRDDMHISAWSMQQVQAMLAARSEREAQMIGIRMAMKVVDWEQGRVPNDWFRRELQRIPVAQNFTVPMANRTVRALDRMKSSLLAMASLTVVAAALIALWRQLTSITSDMVEGFETNRTPKRQGRKRAGRVRPPRRVHRAH